MQNDDAIRRELWFWYFASVLYRNGAISAQRREELERAIRRLGS